MDSESYILWPPEMEDHAYEVIEDIDDTDQVDDIIEDTSADPENYREIEVLESENGAEDDQEYYVGENIIEVPQETFIYYPDDGSVVPSDSNVQHVGVGMSHLIEQRVEEAENKIIGDQEEYTETVEEVITEEDWIQSQGEECVQVAMEQIVASDALVEEENDTVPLQINQDEYTSSRPYPCDFCSRRFRKKANLMNHMVAHQNDRPHVCNLCGVRYIRRHDLINHFKIHSYVPDSTDNAGRSYDSSYEYDADEFDEGAHNYAPKQSTYETKKSQKIIFPKQKQTKQKKTTKKQSYTVSEPKRKVTGPQEERFPITDARKPFVCQSCGVCFTRQKALESHSKLHESDPVFDCEICNESFFDSQSLAEHTRSHHETFEASGSGYKNSGSSTSNAALMPDFEPDDSASDYEPAKNADEDEEDDESMGDMLYFCDHCESNFSSVEQLNRHVRAQHQIKYEHDSKDQTDMPTSQHYCKVCGESFNEALDLLAHAEIHARFQPYRCELCGESWDSESKVKQHLYSVHVHQLTENSCRLCGKLCYDQKNLIKHSWEHSREKCHPCSKCGKIFHNKARLKRHIVSHKKKNVTCETCNEDFPDGRSLMNHRHSHSRQANQFPCYECGKTFGSRSSQQIHIRIHTGERPYGCRFCWKSFCDGGTLRKHERIHTGEKPYACLVCPRAFNQRVVLREHIRSHHSAPDQKHGTALNPYYCTICGDLFPVSLDLISHLIAHCDENTASKRVPVVGPRKYKRRRKLKPSEMSVVDTMQEEFPDANDSDQDAFLGFDVVKIEKPDAEVIKSLTIQEKSDNLLVPLHSTVPEEILESSQYDSKGASTSRDIKPTISSIQKSVPMSSSGRPKMIHTQKTKILVSDGKRKTKTLITKEIKSASAGNKTSAIERRTRSNVKIKQEIKQEFKKPVKQDPCDDIFNENNYSERFDSDIVHDLQEILKSPVKRRKEEQNIEPTRRSTRNRRSTKAAENLFEEQVEHKNDNEKDNNEEEEELEEDQHFMKNSNSESETEEIVIKKEILEENCCQICGRQFDSRNELLTHVGIHI